MLNKKVTRYDIKKIVVILSSSRAGSSLLFDIMKNFPLLYYLQGESVPFFKKHNIISDNSYSEIVKVAEVDQWKVDQIGQDILNNSGRYIDYGNYNNDIQWQFYINQLYERFQLQWPTISFEEKEFKTLSEITLKNHIKNHKNFIVNKFYIELLTILVNRYNDINPYYYDLPLVILNKYFPNIKLDNKPPNSDKLIEEPPFILIKPWQLVNNSMLDSNILLMKTPGNTYRMELIKKIFPNAKFKFIYLTRNPAASINGLYDGWLYRGFYSYNLKKQLDENDKKLLSIKGYSDKYPWGKHWWNFDLPPGWEKYINSSLEEVCAYQYYQNNKHILNYLSKSLEPYIKIKFEDIIDSHNRQETLNQILDFLNQNTTIDKCMDIRELPVVQASKKPSSMRWKKREDIILPTINKIEFVDIVNKMGYFIDKKERWL